MGPLQKKATIWVQCKMNGSNSPAVAIGYNNFTETPCSRCFVYLRKDFKFSDFTFSNSINMLLNVGQKQKLSCGLKHLDFSRLIFAVASDVSSWRAYWVSWGSLSVRRSHWTQQQKVEKIDGLFWHSCILKPVKCWLKIYMLNVFIYLFIFYNWEIWNIILCSAWRIINAPLMWAGLGLMKDWQIMKIHSY